MRNYAINERNFNIENLFFKSSLGNESIKYLGFKSFDAL